MVGSGRPLYPGAFTWIDTHSAEAPNADRARHAPLLKHINQPSIGAYIEGTMDAHQDPPQPADLDTLLALAEDTLIPAVRSCVATGNTPFAATILDANLTPLETSANNDASTPVSHAETNCIHSFLALPESTRPAASDVILLSTHEPCAMCLGAVCWASIKTVYFLFTYDETKGVFGMGEDIEIAEVFGARGPPWYNRTNKFFTARPVAELLEGVKDDRERVALGEEVERVKALLSELWPAEQG